MPLSYHFGARIACTPTGVASEAIRLAVCPGCRDRNRLAYSRRAEFVERGFRSGQRRHAAHMPENVVGHVEGVTKEGIASPSGSANLLTLPLLA